MYYMNNLEHHMADSAHQMAIALVNDFLDKILVLREENAKLEALVAQLQDHIKAQESEIINRAGTR